MPPKSPPPANFTALRRYAHLSHSVAHSRESHFPDISRDTLLAQQSAYDAKLTEAITEVRRKIIDEELRLSSLQSQHPAPSPDEILLEIPATAPPREKLQKIKVLKAAHDKGFQSIDYIPPAASPLNTLLAYRSVQRVSSQTNASIGVVSGRVKAAQATLKSENVVAGEQKRLMAALKARLETLEEEERRLDVGGDIGAGDAIRGMVKAKKELARRTVKLLRELLYFLDSGLARMVAAEEMGGPVVGDELEVTLETGFDKKGRVRKGERRIDEMWGQGEEGPEKRVVGEFKDLLEELMNASLETSPYVELKKDSAIARFLVRAKVAVFHPKDARKLRLVDFGSNVEDG